VLFSRDLRNCGIASREKRDGEIERVKELTALQQQP
jgi:hypothetical protein